MNVLYKRAAPLAWKKSFFWLVFGVTCFHLAYTSLKFPVFGLFIVGYALALIQLADQPTVRRAFYFGLATGFFCAAPQFFFFWKIFSVAAIVLWLVFAFWIGLFTAISCGCIRRWGKIKAMWLVPFIWTGLEYFRSELYYLKFSWLNIGYALQFPFGMYGVGFFVFAFIVGLFYARNIKVNLIGTILIILVIFYLLFDLSVQSLARAKHYSRDDVLISIAGIQMEFPPQHIIPKMLDKALNKNPNAQIFVLSEYTLDAAVPDSLKNWCREHSRFLVIGGKDFVTNDVYYNTAFVIGTNGEVIFKQAKSVPIQFFHDGLPAPKLEVWNSPWGKIGICICYDLSYTRVTDELIRQGAQLLIVPTMDVEEWGRHEHELHSRVAPVRAAEYGIPIFRVASSGISQAISASGDVVAKTSIGINGDIFSAQLRLPAQNSLPIDRFLAPLSVCVAGLVTAILLFFTWKEKNAKL